MQFSTSYLTPLSSSISTHGFLLSRKYMMNETVTSFADDPGLTLITLGLLLAIVTVTISKSKWILSIASLLCVGAGVVYVMAQQATGTVLT